MTNREGSNSREHCCSECDDTEEPTYKAAYYIELTNGAIPSENVSWITPLPAERSFSFNVVEFTGQLSAYPSSNLMDIPWIYQ